ncbi:MAG: T9SS type A sorting domain-containing protein, partial [Bacteroidota bacterium]
VDLCPIVSIVIVNLLRRDTDTGLFEFYEFDRTASNGTFEFINLPPADYRIEFDAMSLPAGFIFTPKKDINGNSNDDIDSDVDPSGVISNINLVSSQPEITNIGAGIIDEAILPVVLIRFTAELANQNEVLLQWATASEDNNQFFILERSTDGMRFEAIGSVVGNGTTSEFNSYSYLDESPFFGRNYYRLKQVDFDGRYDYSTVRSVVIEGEDLAAAIVYPNPAKDFTNVRVVSPFETDAQIEVVNAMGQIVSQSVLAQGSNSQQVDMSFLQPGYYFIVIRYEDHKSVVQRVLKVQD